MVGVEAGTYRVKALEAAQQQRGSGKHDESQRDLCRDQRAT